MFYIYTLCSENLDTTLNILRVFTLDLYDDRYYHELQEGIPGQGYPPLPYAMLGLIMESMAGARLTSGIIEYKNLQNAAKFSVIARKMLGKALETEAYGKTGSRSLFILGWVQDNFVFHRLHKQPKWLAKKLLFNSVDQIKSTRMYDREGLPLSTEDKLVYCIEMNVLFCWYALAIIHKLRPESYARWLP